MDEIYREFVSAVIMQAILDHLEYRYKIEHTTNSWEKHHAEMELARVEEFFCSERFMLFSDMDGREILEVVKKMPPQKGKRGKGAMFSVW